MRTEDLINALVVDLTVSKVRFRQILVGATALGSIYRHCRIFVLDRSSSRHRPSAADSALFVQVRRYVESATTTAGLLWRLARPGVPTGPWAWAWLAAPALLLVASRGRTHRDASAHLVAQTRRNECEYSA